MVSKRLYDELLSVILRARSAVLSPKIQQAIKYIDKHYAKRIALVTVAGAIGIHPNHLCRQFRKELGLPFQKYVVMARVRKAMSLLAYTEKQIKMISHEVGYNRPEVFAKTFKQFVGFSPREYRKQFRYG